MCTRVESVPVTSLSEVSNNRDSYQVYTGSLKSDPTILDDLRKLFWAEVAKTDLTADPTADIVLHYHPINDVMQKSGSRLPMDLDTGNGPDFCKF